MEIPWDDVAKQLGPLLGVALGAALASGQGRRGFQREFMRSEIHARRTAYAQYAKALWAYASRVLLARSIVEAGGKTFDPLSSKAGGGYTFG